MASTFFKRNPEADQYIINNFNHLTYAEMGQHLGISLYKIRNRLRSLGLIRKPIRPPQNKEQIEQEVPGCKKIATGKLYISDNGNSMKHISY